MPSAAPQPQRWQQTPPPLEGGRGVGGVHRVVEYVRDGRFVGKFIEWRWWVKVCD